MRSITRLGHAAVLLLAILLGRPAVAGAAADWNDAVIHWRPYTQGLAEARAQHKPVCVVLYPSWCPHCRNYRRVFYAPDIVHESQEFVMIRVDADAHPAISRRFAYDGEYIPRTYFMSSAGRIDPRIHADRDAYAFFYDEDNPISLLDGMVEARQLLH